MSHNGKSVQVSDKEAVAPDVASVAIEIEGLNQKDYSENKTRWADASFTLEQLKADDFKAWHKLTEIFGEIAKAYVLKSFNNPGDLQPLTIHDAEELTSMVIEYLYKCIAKFKTLDHLEASFRKALKNQTISRVRHLDAQKRGDGMVLSASDPELLLSPQKSRADPIEAEFKAKLAPFTNDAEEDDSAKVIEGINVILGGVNIEMTELGKTIFDCATELSEKERTLIALIYEKRTQLEIAEAIGIGVKQVAVELKRIYKKIQRKLLVRLGEQGLKDYGIKNV